MNKEIPIEFVVLYFCVKKVIKFAFKLAIWNGNGKKVSIENFVLKNKLHAAKIGVLMRHL